MSDGYDMGEGEVPDPVAFGWNVADFDIAEPMGALIDVLRNDESGTGWWGSLGDEVPRRPTP